jgi:hypothetical protein
MYAYYRKTLRVLESACDDGAEEYLVVGGGGGVPLAAQVQVAEGEVNAGDWNAKAQMGYRSH